jgi:pimeloyl-[acyl-carrier protein] methyl ester esterase
MNQINLFLLPGLDGTGQLFHPLSANLPEYLVPCLIQYPPDIFLDYNLLVEYARERISTDKPFVLLAESFSGPVALELAASERCNLVAVILCATFISNPAPKPLSWIGSLLGAMLFKLTPPRFLIRYYLLGQRASEQLVNNFMSAVQSVSGKVLLSRLKCIFNVDAKDALRACPVPILYLSGKQDKLVSERSLQEIRAIKPEVEVARIDGPHLLLQREPVESAEAIDGFLRDRLMAV